MQGEEEEMGEDDPAIDAAPVVAPPEQVKEEIKAEPHEDEEEAVQAAEVTSATGPPALDSLDPSMQDTLVMEDVTAWSEPRISKALSQDSGPQSLLSSPEVKPSWKPLPDPESAEPSTCEGPAAEPSTCEGPAAKPSTSEGPATKPSTREGPAAKPSTSEGPAAKPSTSEGPAAKPSTSGAKPEPPSPEDSQKHRATGPKDCMHVCD